MTAQDAPNIAVHPEAASPSVQEFETSVRGEVIQLGVQGYDVARQVWNAMIDKYPDLIVQCAGVADVLTAVQFARTHNFFVAVRGGGHNVTVNATCDGGMVIDLSLMKSKRIDPLRRTARAGSGLTWGEFDHETQAFGLALPGGIQSTTGIAGFTLGGSFGYLARKHGLTCDNLLSADVITADGQFLKERLSQHSTPRKETPMNRDSQKQLTLAPYAVATSKEQEVLAQWGFTSEEIASLLWLSHKRHILEFIGESYPFRQEERQSGERKTETGS